MLIPYEYQKKVIEQGKAIIKQHRHLALAPVDMGLGKTMMSLRIAKEICFDLIIIICPKTLMSNWKKEIGKCTEIKNVILWSATKSKTQKWKKQFNFWFQKNTKIIIINIESFQTRNKDFQKLLNKLETIQNQILILDESTKIKNPDALRTKNLLSVFDDASKMILTGTPITNSPLDFFAQYEFLKPNFWNIQANTLKQSFYRFRARYAVLVDERVSRDRVIKKVIGFKKLDELKNKIEYCTIQLKKEDCVDLPEKIEQDIILEMSGEHRQFYDEFVKRLIAQLDDDTLSVTSAIAKFTRVRQICGGFFKADSGEIKTFADNRKKTFLLDEIEDTSEKIIISANYHEEINLLYEMLIEEYDKDSTVCYTGLQSVEVRANNLEAFEKNERTRFLILNPMTGAFGLNLQFCRIMYFYSLPTSPEQYQQLKDRIHRIGQTKNCLYKYVMYQDTIDERIKLILNQKQELSKLFTSKDMIKEFLLKGGEK